MVAYVEPRRADTSERMRAGRGFAVVAAAMFLVLAGANVPTPLYDVYRRAWGFSPLEMTAVFAMYPLSLVGTLLGFARFADRFGRRPVLLAAVLASIAGSGAFALASGPSWLFGARLLQAVAVGLLSAAATAALVELEPNADRRRATVVATIALAFGTASGPLVSGLLVQFAPAPLVVPFALHAALSLPLLAALSVWLHETAPSPRARDWRPRIPRLEASVAVPLLIAGLTSGLGWAVAALFISVVPSYLRIELGLGSAAFAGAVAFATLATSALVQLRLGSIAERRAIATGLVCCVAGVGVLVLAVPLHSTWLLAVAVLACGTGHALALVGSLALANRVAPTAARGEAISLFYAITYLVVGVPIVGIGVVASAAGFFAGFVAFFAFLVIAAAGVLAALSRTGVRREPRPARPSG